MQINLARIDDRLIHGQVATVWVKSLQIERILVVSEEVTRNPMRKTMSEQAAPPGVSVNVITPTKLIEIFHHPLFQNVKVMLLFTNPSEVMTVVKGGVSMTSMNIGGMSYTHGKQMISNAIAVDEADVRAFKFLAAQGIELEVRKVISDNKQDLMELIEKKKRFNQENE